MRDDTATATHGRLIAACSTLRDLEHRTHDPDKPAVRTRPVGKPGSRPPVPISALSVRREALDAAAGWARLVIEERELDSRLLADTAGHVAEWLIPHAEWLAAHPAGRDAARELEHHAEQYRHVAQPTGRRRFRLGYPCPTAAADGDCPGELLAEVQGHDDYAPTGIVCSRNREHAWNPEQWNRLGLLLRQDDQRVLLRSARLLDSLRIESREVHR